VAQNEDAEIRALQALIEALQPLDDDARSRVLEYTLKRLGMRELSTSSTLAEQPEPSPPTPEPPIPAHVTDIRSLTAQKQPSTAVEMAAIVAYYLAEAAPTSERKAAVTTGDIEKYFKQANYRLPTQIKNTLNNAAAAGYFDRPDRGQYRLNPVGFNLVTQTLPRGSGQATPRRAPASKKKKTATQRSKPDRKK
jgi:hypothetical protein